MMKCSRQGAPHGRAIGAWTFLSAARLRGQQLQTKTHRALRIRRFCGHQCPRPGWASSFVCAALLLLVLLCGCATPTDANVHARLYSPKDERGAQEAARLAGIPREPDEAKSLSGRHFDFERDTFAYANELVWEYSYDAQGHWQTHTREVKPTYHQHCFVMARSARQFFDNALFEPSLPPVEESVYRERIRRVVKASPRRPLPEAQKVIFPGYADLRSFSREHEKLLKSECGPATQSYIQIGNWRTILPFTRGHQERMARQLVAHLRNGRPVLVHVLRFPQLSINHALLVFQAEETPSEVNFPVYDPNHPEQPGVLIFERATRTFRLPPSNYFFGGAVNVYEIYWKWNY